MPVTVVDTGDIVAATSAPMQEADLLEAIGAPPQKEGSDGSAAGGENGSDADTPAVSDGGGDSESPDHPVPDSSGGSAAAAPEAGAAPEGRDDKGRFVKGGKPRDSMYARFEAEHKRAEELAAKLAALEAQARPPQPRVEAPTSQPVAPASRAKPLESQVGEKYPTYADYIEDLADWKAEQRYSAIQRQESERRDLEQMQAQYQTLTAKVTEARSRFTDWDQRAIGLEQAFRAAGLEPILPPAAHRAILSSDSPAEILYYLGTHPEEAIELARASAGAPVSSAPWIRRSLERLVGAASGPAAALPSRQSRAAPPPKPVGSAPNTTADVDPESLDADAYIAHWNKTHGRRRR